MRKERGIGIGGQIGGQRRLKARGEGRDGRVQAGRSDWKGERESDWDV